MDTPIEHLDLSSPESNSLAFTIWTWVFKFFALYIGLTTSLYSMSLMGNTTASFFARCLTAYIMLMLCALYGVFASIILRLVGMHRMSQWIVARAYKWTMRFTTRVRFEVIAGKEHLKERPVVFVGNHQTALDVLLLGTIFPRWCSVTAKKQLKAMPFLGWFMAVSGTVFIDRGNRATALKAFEGAAKEITTKRQSVFIFPEGTRSNTDEPMLLPFKKGAFHLAVQAGVPIVPVVAANYSGVLSLKEWRFRAGVIPVIVLKPIPTKDLDASDVDQLTKYTRDLMLKALIKLTESTRGQKAFRADPSTVPDRKIGAPEDAAVAAAVSSGTDTVMDTKPSAGDELRKHAVRTEMDKQTKSDGLAE